jgi:phage protein D
MFRVLVISMLLGTMLPWAAAGKDVGGAWGHGALRASVQGDEVPTDAEIVVDQLSPVDEATLTFRDERKRPFADTLRVGVDVRVETARPSRPGTVFTGEVVGFESIREKGGTKVVIRAFNRMHRLTRGRKSRTFEDVSDAQIVARIAEENGLSAKVVPEPVDRYGQVFQHNQTDLEFLLQRASRIGYEVFVEGTTLHFTKPEEASPLVLSEKRKDADVRLREFRPRLSSTATVQAVVVRGWDPVTKKEIVGRATARTILLTRGADDPTLLFGRTVDLPTDLSLDSQHKVDAAALAELAARSATLLSGEAACVGDPGLKPGALVVLEGANARFGGKYYVVGCTHRVSHASKGDGGYVTLLRVRRNDGALFHIPSVDDEVLVGFEHGDLGRPIVLGSLWNGTDRPPAR